MEFDPTLNHRDSSEDYFKRKNNLHGSVQAKNRFLLTGIADSVYRLGTEMKTTKPVEDNEDCDSVEGCDSLKDAYHLKEEGRDDLVEMKRKQKKKQFQELVLKWIRTAVYIVCSLYFRSLQFSPLPSATSTTTISATEPLWSSLS